MRATAALLSVTFALTFASAYILICLPWFLFSRSAGGAIQGNPMLLYTAEYPGYSSSRTLNAHLPGMLEYVLAHPVTETAGAPPAAAPPVVIRDVKRERILGALVIVAVVAAGKRRKPVSSRHTRRIAVTQNSI